MTNQSVKDASTNELKMQFDPNTIQHLGIQMYSTLPPVIAELVANSYDADAKEVKIYLNDLGEKHIKIWDNGHGMTFDQINEKFLKIGRNRRVVDDSQLSESGKRRVIGKKGIGKLSFFGIASLIEVETVRDGLINAFRMDLEKIQKVGAERKDYNPEIIVRDKSTNKQSQTSFKLERIKRKSDFEPEDIAYNLAKSFSIFDDPKFNVKIFHNNGNPIQVKNDLKYKHIESEFRWNLPLKAVIRYKGEKIDYKYASKIKGEVIASKETVPSAIKGLALFSRGKLVNDHSFFDVVATSIGYSYITGWLDVGFIDDWEKEVISTNRRSLNWEDEDVGLLKQYLNGLIHYIYNEHREKRKQKKKQEIKKRTGLDIDKWIGDLPRHDQKLANKIVNTIINDEGIEPEKSGELVSYIKDSFQFESFKELASEITDTSELYESKIIVLLKEWELIEAREFYKISLVRIKAIKTFEKYIKENAKEVPSVHNFFKTFPWLLDPRIMEFKDEVYFSELLREKYPDSDEELDSNKRIDFLCTSLANHRFIIELKRPAHRIRGKDLTQAQKYRNFVESYSGTEKFEKKLVVAYLIIGDRYVKNLELKESIEMWEKEGKIFIRTYGELLEQAKKYHSEFISRYEQIKRDLKDLKDLDSLEID